jgi:hypothetical protein
MRRRLLLFLGALLVLVIGISVFLRHSNKHHQIRRLVVPSRHIAPNNLRAAVVAPRQRYKLAGDCTIVANQPLYGYETLPGSQRQLIVHQTGCPSSTISNIALSGTTLTVTVADATVFTVGKKVVFTGFFDYPLNRLLEGVTLTITGASGTTLTANYPNPVFQASSTAVTAVVTQNTLINWSSTSGTLSCASNCLPTVTFTTDNVPGNITTVEPASPFPVSGKYTLQSTHTMTVTACSVDDGSKCATFTILQAALSTNVNIVGAHYTQAYKGQRKRFFSIVEGNTNENVTWTCTSQSGSGDCVLDYINKRDVVAHATIPDRYTLTATSVADNSKIDTAVIDVQNANIPNIAVPPDGGEFEACFQSSQMTGVAYHVGPSQTYTSIGAALNAYRSASSPQGSSIIIHNEDTTGTNPTTYAEYFLLSSINTRTQPFNLCGIPNTTGHLPVITGANATTTNYPNGSLLGSGLITLYPQGSCVGAADATGSCGPTFIRIAGLKLTNTNGSYNYVPPGGGSNPWGGDAINFRTGANLTVEGTSFNSTLQGVGTYANQNGGYAALSQSVYWHHSYTVNNGANGSSGSHPVYAQSIRGNVFDALYIDAAQLGSSGSGFKMRGTSNIFTGSYVASGFSRCCDFVEAQDPPDWITFENGLALGGPYNNGALTDLNAQTARLEKLFKDFVWGNIINGGGFHYLADHDDNVGDYGMNARYGELFSFFNTFPGFGAGYDTSNQYNNNYFLAQRFYNANNILWQAGGFVVNTEAMFIGDFHTNVVVTGQNNTVPIWGIYYSDGGAQGWGGKTQDSNTYIMVRPLSAHVTGDFVTDFLISSTQPFDSTTFAPSGVALNGASAITGPASEFGMPYNAVVVPGVYVPRTETTSIGAVGLIVNAGVGTVFTGASSGTIR